MSSNTIDLHIYLRRIKRLGTAFQLNKAAHSKAICTEGQLNFSQMENKEKCELPKNGAHISFQLIAIKSIRQDNNYTGTTYVFCGDQQAAAIKLRAAVPIT
ncbi:hypothetical protein BW21_2415 [Burkholderia humptydooensis]|nr:hypothetical protein BW21_2415 [Burkholderia sp. 2002721687]